MEEDIISNNYALLVVNYFSLISRKILKKYKRKFNNLIIDNTQSFFSKPIMDCYNVYSCRKFFGVPDGSYLIKKGLKQKELAENKSSKISNFLISSIEFGTNDVYLENLENENRLNNEDIKDMSILTKKLLRNIDYKKVRKKRRKNFLYLHKKLKDYNEISVTNKRNTFMIYPFLIKDDGLRKYLIQNKIWVSQWWKYCLENENCNEFEKYLSKYLIPLPIDQRYCEQDMEYLCNLIMDYINNKFKIK